MSSLSDTIARLAAMRKMAARADMAAVDRLTDLDAFGSNPGALRARTYIPAGLGAHAPLVVVLHGCTQTAAGYDTGAGWSRLADEHGFALLFPEQRRANNANLCFSWFSPDDIQRGSGEALSIRQMITATVRAHAIDPDRVFVTGLSAGGAMTSVMLAAYPEVFAGGAIIAGLPYGSVNSIPQAFDRMRGQGYPAAAELAAQVRRASQHQGPWPTISIWHGSGDATVNPSNADAIVGQWRALHGLDAAPSRTELVDGYPRRVWCDATGTELIEEYSITGMGHGTPLDTRGPDGCGASGAYMLEASISSTRHIAGFWGLLGEQPRAKAPRADEPRHAEQEAARSLPVPRTIRAERIADPAPSAPPHAMGPSGVGKVIEDALRAAGLMR